MENYCTSCGKWSCLAAFWRCRDCLNRFYDRRRHGGEQRDRLGTGRSVLLTRFDCRGYRPETRSIMQNPVASSGPWACASDRCRQAASNHSEFFA